MTARKICTQCGESKPTTTAFYLRTPARGGDRERRCKACISTYKKALRRKHYAAVYARERAYRLSAAGKAANARYSNSPKGKAARRIALRWWRLTHPETYQAQNRRAIAKRKAALLDGRHRLVALVHLAALEQPCA